MLDTELREAFGGLAPVGVVKSLPGDDDGDYLVNWNYPSGAAAPSTSTRDCLDFDLSEAEIEAAIASIREAT